MNKLLLQEGNHVQPTAKQKQSAFEKHREKVLGHYGTASFLRSVVLALWNGTDNKVGLSRINSLDHEHFDAFMDMILQYRNTGENDCAFMDLAEAVRSRVAEERRAAERAERFEEWCREVASILRLNGSIPGRRASDVVDDHYDWLDSRFDKLSADDAAAELVLRVRSSS